MSKSHISAKLRKLVSDRAQNCCEYCLIPESLTLVSHQVDHVIAEKHGGKTTEENLALSCSLCNQAKGSDIASIDVETGEVIRLYHPRQDQWQEHFQMEECVIYPLTAIGRVTTQLLKINLSACLPYRKMLAQAKILIQK
ncbi:HNH endonuclease [Pseudanabaena sp. UWO311]|uniref:HNH endonuclease n=1 Tax=Pseudanabaena sp. UWO311 TaxID=2487337 RepID=UPI001157AB14|nr:HNH endonuclease signature motif containing protein [Pseudanabaena sp. UWO311]TYQ25411.1 HNH endonuclease [Pseudanabaena sp. UWO311]